MENKKVEEIFKEKYSNTENNYFEKTCLALLVEIGEFANETKCFKYWSVKKPEYEKIIEELSDCIILVLTLFEHFKIDVMKLKKIEFETDIIESFIQLFNKSSQLIHDIDGDNLVTTLMYLLHIKEILGISDEKLVISCFNKLIIVKDRLNTNY